MDHDDVETATEAYTEAEFEWCGSFPLALVSGDDDDEVEEDPERPDTPVLTFAGRWDFAVTDEDTLIEAGRAAFLESWPEEEREDAVVRVRSLVEAAGEITHLGGPAALEATDGLELERDSFAFVLHDGGDDDEFDDDPFAIVQEL